jgi:hypothetical protein
MAVHREGDELLVFGVVDGSRQVFSGLPVALITGPGRMTVMNDVAGPPAATSALDIAVERAPHPWEHQFAVYAASETGWMGGDSTYSVSLANGQRLWLFSDTRLADDRWINNSVVIQSPDGTLRTVHGGTAAEPDALVVPPSRIGEDGLTRWLWTSDAVALDGPDHPVADHRLWTFFQEFRSTKPDSEKGEWDFAWVRSILVELSLPDLRVLGQTPIDDGTGVQWGAAVQRVGDELLVYGLIDQGHEKHLAVAKSQLSDLSGRWSYRTADQRWSSQPGDTGRLLTGVSNEFAVLPLPGPTEEWLLVTSDTTLPFGEWPIVAYWSTDATGPWTGPIPVHDPAREANPPVGGNRYAYNPTLVQLADTSFVLAYNVNSTLEEVTADPRIYRPRFRQVRISRR